MLTNSTANASGVHQIKGDQYLGFMRQNGAALRQVFEPSELDMIAAIGLDIDRAMRTHATRGLTSSPGTAQDIGAAKETILSGIMKEIGPAGLAMAAHAAGANPIISGAAWLGSKTLGRMRAAGLGKADALVTEAMLDPALAKRLLAKIPDKPDSGAAQSLGDQFVRIARSTVLGEMAQERDRRATRH